MSTTETNSIDEKKAEEEGTSTEKADWPGFFASFGSGVLTTICIGVILVGSIGLYTAKVAHANILPDDINLQPYTNVERNVKNRFIYMNPLKIRSFYGLNFWSDPEAIYSQRVNFNNKEFLNSFSDSWLCNIEEWAKPGSFLSHFWLFESKVLKPMTANTFELMNSIFYRMNYLPEWLIMLLYSIIFTFVFFGLYIYNFFTGIFLHLRNLYQYFLNPTENDQTKWDTENPSYFNIKNMLMFFFIWTTTSFLSVMFSPFFITIYCLLSPLFATYKAEKGDKTYDFTTFLKDVITYKKTFILALVIYKLISATNTYLGSSYLSGVSIALLILIFGLKIYVTAEPTNDATEILLDKKTLPDLSKQPIATSGVEDPGFCKKKEDISDSIDETVNQNGGKKMKTIEKGKVNSNTNFKIKRYNVKLV